MSSDVVCIIEDDWCGFINTNSHELEKVIRDLFKDYKRFM